MKKAFYLFTAIIFFICANIFPQYPNWQRAYSNSNSQSKIFGYSCCTAGNDNYYFLGSDQNLYTSFVKKVNKYGSILSEKIFSFQALAMMPDNNGGYFLCADKFYRVSANQNVLWGINVNDPPRKIIITSDGNLIGTGLSSILKFNLTGSIIWYNQYTNSGITVNDITELSYTCYMVAGTFDTLGTQTRSFFMKINNQGNTVWEKRFRINQSLPIDMKFSRIDNLIYVGANYSESASLPIKPLLLKIDENASILDTNFISLNTLKDYYSNDFIKISTSAFLYTGIIYDTASISTFKGFAFICDSDGNIKKLKEFTDSTFTVLFKVFLENSRLIFSGSSNHYSENHFNLYAVSTDTSLSAPFVGIAGTGSVLPQEYKLYENYPNPFNSSSVIKFDIPEKAFVSINIYDLSGRKITSLLSETRQAGSYSIKFDASGLSSGVYICRMQADNFITARRLVLLK